MFASFNVSETQDLLLQECAGTKLKPEFRKRIARGDAFSQSMNRTFGFCSPTLGDGNEGGAGLAVGERTE